MTLAGARAAALAALSEAPQHGAPLAVVTPKSELTVADACRDYVTALEKDGRKTASIDAKRRFERCLYGDKLGKVRLKDLHQDHIEAWRDRVEKGDLPPLPVKRGRPPVPKPLARSSINRIRTTLVAPLNHHAVAHRKVSPDLAFEWNAVKPLKDASQCRGLYLEREQRRALETGEDLSVSSTHALSAMLSKLGATPTDESKVSHPQDNEDSDEHLFH